MINFFIFMVIHNINILNLKYKFTHPKKYFLILNVMYQSSYKKRHIF